MLQTEAALRVSPVKVNQQAQAAQLGSLPTELFHRVLQQVFPDLRHLWQQRKRSLSLEFSWVQAHYRQVVSCDWIS
jgi:hypothetical protein